MRVRAIKAADTREHMNEGKEEKQLNKNTWTIKQYKAANRHKARKFMIINLSKICVTKKQKAFEILM